MSKRCDVAVIGASGYTGDELLRILLAHPHVTVTAVTSRQLEGKTVAEVVGPGVSSSTLRFTHPPIETLSLLADVFFLALPHGVAAEYAVPLLAAGKVVVDLSADFRLKDAGAYQKYYHAPHPAPALLDEAVYGLPEIHREALAQARLIACPGCYPTNAILGLKPALEAGLIDPAQIVINALSGISGAGKKADTLYSFSERSENLAAYSIPVHRHLPEIEQELSGVAGRPVRVSFVPHLVPVVRGMLGTLSAPLARAIEPEEVQSIYEAAWQDSPFVHVLPAGNLPETRRVLRTNHCELAVRIDAHAGRLVVVSATDNLGKGASSQAVQAFNIRMGWPETEGLL
jgi:N-acetyl-gamma-glutamyl-phosphate reductase